MSKYNNKKCTIDNIKFDSIAEGRRYSELKLLLKVGEITNLQLQPKYLLQDSFKKNGKAYRKIEYVADFYYITKDDKEVVEDVKGYCNQLYLMKKKLFEYKYKELTIVEVK